MTALRLRAGLADAISWATRFAQRLAAVRVVESSLVLAAQAFLALFPLAIVAYAVLPTDAANGLIDTLRSRFGLSGGSADAMHDLIGARSSLRQGLSFLGFAIVLGSATSFTRAMQRVYERAWGLDKLGLRGAWRGLAWVVGIVVYFGLIGFLVHVIRHGGISTALTTVVGFGLWWWTPFLLLGGRVRARVLLPGAVLTTFAQLAVTLVSVIVLPRAIRNNESTYGPIGAVFAIESWLVVVAGVLVTGAAIGAEIGLSAGRFGSWLRGHTDPEHGWQRVPARPARKRRDG